MPAKINKLAAGAPSGGRLSVIGILSGGGGLGFADGPSGGPSGFVVFAESPIPAGHKVSLPKDFAFSQLNFALYLGDSQRRSALVEASVSTVPLTGRTAVATVPFGDTTLTLVGTPMGTLGGSLDQRLPWIVGVIGVVLSLAAALMTERLVRRRRLAESLAAENRRLYGEQHGIAEALQRALLPNELPALGGVEIDGRYVAGMESMDIGGDWYDVIASDDDHFLFVVGDVSGRGVRAATIMASLHYSIRAYAAEGDPPSAILTKLCSLLDVDRDAHFATILAGYVDIDRREVTLSSAGHFGPLLMSRDETDYVDVVTGVPIGIDTSPTYPTVTVTVPRHGTLPGLHRRAGGAPGRKPRRRSRAAAGCGRKRRRRHPRQPAGGYHFAAHTPRFRRRCGHVGNQMAELDDGGTTASVARLSDDRRTPAVSIAGEIDISNADQVKAALLAEVGDAPQHIIVDVSALTFMDSSGIAILVQVSKSVAPVELRNPTPIVRRVIKATGLSEHFGMAE